MNILKIALEKLKQKRNLQKFKFEISFDPLREICSPMIVEKIDDKIGFGGPRWFVAVFTYTVLTERDERRIISMQYGSVDFRSFIYRPKSMVCPAHDIFFDIDQLISLTDLKAFSVAAQRSENFPLPP